MKDMIKEIITKYGIITGYMEQIYDTTWQIGDNYVLKVYDDINMIERNTKILDILAQMGIPVGKIIRTRNGENYTADEKHYYLLSQKLQGSNIVNVRQELGIAVQMGEIIANLHLAFQKCEEQEEFWNNSLLEEMNGWIKDTFENNDWKDIGREKFEQIVSKLEQLYSKLPVQLIHRDVHFGNFLFCNEDFSGYIDFDLSQRNIRIFDLCYFLLGLLSERDKTEITDVEWFDFIKDVFKGYGSKIKIIKEEKMAVPYVMESIELLFIAYFLSVQDRVCAENAYEILKLVINHEEQIWKCI